MVLSYVVRVSLLLLLLVCCNYYSVNGRTSSFVSSWAPKPTTTFSVHHHSTSASRRTSSSPRSAIFHTRTRTTIAAAAIMTPENSSGVSVSISSGGASPNNTNKKDVAALPNWRVVDVHNNDENDTSAICSPFCHSLLQQQSNNNESPSTAIIAPWSQESYEQSLHLHKQLTTCTDPYISPLIKNALHDIEMSFRLYGPTNMISSYNGGKDAVVIFHLVRAVHAHYYSQLSSASSNNNNFMTISRPRVIYFQHDDEFPEVLSLLNDTVQKYDVDMIAFREGTSFGDGLKYLVERNLAPSSTSGRNANNNNNNNIPPPPYPLAFVLGTRKDDPNAGSQGVYAPSSHYMPPFLRVNPILDWTYGAVWYFLRLFDLPYCTLYDDGYTSLGTVKDTLPCPALKKNDDNGEGDEDEYWPAYMLRDWSQERAGRIDKKKMKTKQTSKKENDESVAQQDKAVGVTMSQTSSTVSLPPTIDENETTKLTESMSTILNISEEEEAQSDTDRRKNTGGQFSPGKSHGGRPTVGLIVIGDELLKGMTPDSNIISAAKALRHNNVTLSRVSIISDDGQDIQQEIQRFMNDVDVIITSGGVGPTHDDVTIKSVAEALDLDMEMNDEMA